MVTTVVVALVTALAVVNFNAVKVHWIVATGQTPLIVVIVLLASGLGTTIDRLLVLRGRRRGNK